MAKIDELYQLENRRQKTERKRKKNRIYRYDFTPNGVDLNSFPYNVWRKLSKDILLDDKDRVVPIRRIRKGNMGSGSHLQLSASGKRRELSSGADRMEPEVIIFYTACMSTWKRTYSCI